MLLCAYVVMGRHGIQLFKLETGSKMIDMVNMYVNYVDPSRSDSVLRKSLVPVAICTWCIIETTGTKLGIMFKKKIFSTRITTMFSVMNILKFLLEKRNFFTTTENVKKLI